MVVYIHLYCSLVSDAFGYNAVIVPGEYTTRLPANVDDTCFRPDSVTLPPPDDNSLEKNIAPLITKFRFAILFVVVLP